MTQPRPKWNQPEVQAAAVKRFIAEVTEWATAALPAVDISSDESRQHLLAVTTLAVQESADAYAAGRYLESFMDWPVDGELVRILDRAYAEMPKVAGTFIHAWVMSEKVRFPAKDGDFVSFRVGPVTMQGTVLATIQREARAIVEVKTGPNASTNMPVNAEDVVSVVKGVTKPKGGGNNPTGGTPIAPRGGAILKKAKAA